MIRRLSVFDMSPEQIRAEFGSNGIVVAVPAQKAATPAIRQNITLVPMKAKPQKKKRFRNSVAPGSRNPVAIAGEIHDQTEKAFKFFDGLVAVWLPKSQCEYDEHEKAMVMPEWLAYEKKLI